MHHRGVSQIIAYTYCHTELTCGLLAEAVVIVPAKSITYSSQGCAHTSASPKGIIEFITLKPSLLNRRASDSVRMLSRTERQERLYYCYYIHCSMEKQL